MNRNYVKPTIEGEQFQADEYVAACWVVTCDKGETGVVFTSGDSYNIDRQDADNDGFGTMLDSTLGSWLEQVYYYGNITLSDGSVKSGEHPSWNYSKANYHELTNIQSGANGGAASVRPNHPNASN